MVSGFQLGGRGVSIIPLMKGCRAMVAAGVDWEATGADSAGRCISMAVEASTLVENEG